MPLINCEISLPLKWSKDGILVAGTAANQEPKFEITNAKLYVPVVILSTIDNVKILNELESGFKEQLIGININLKQQFKRETGI